MPPNGTGESVAKSIIDSLGLSEPSHIPAIVTEGTFDNADDIKGDSVQIKSYLKEKLHWNVSI